LDRSWIKVLCKPRLNNPIFIQGLSSSDQVSSIVTRFLLEHTKPEKIAEFYSPYFPDYVVAEDDGLCSLPRYEFYASDQFNPNILLLTGDVQPLPDDTYANYEIFTTIFDYAREMGCKRFVSYKGFKSDQAENSIYIAATSGKLASNVAEKFGGKIFVQGRLGGPVGLILGLAHPQGLKGLCVLKPLAERVPAEVAALSIFNYLLKLLESRKE